MCEDTKGFTFAAASSYVDLAAEVFTLLADPTRIRIILALCDRELPVNELAELVGKSPTAVSQHLAKLRWGRIVRPRQNGNRVYYTLADEHARQLVTQAVYQAQHVVDERPSHHDGHFAAVPPAVQDAADNVRRAAASGIATKAG